MRQAREVASDRLRHASFWWGERCAAHFRYRPREGPQTRKLPAGSGIIVRFPEPYKADKEFLRRIANDPAFRGHISKQLWCPAAAGRHRRGRMWTKRREALLHIWIQLLTTGDVTRADLERGPMTPRAILDWEAAKADSRIPHVLTLIPDMRKGAVDSESMVSPVTHGAPSPETVSKLIGRRFTLMESGGYDASDLADAAQTGLPAWGSSRWNVTAEHVEDLAWTQRAALRELDEVRAETVEHRRIIRVLRQDFETRWWPLDRLNDFLFIDIAIGWWLTLSQARRESILGQRYRTFLTPRRVRRVDAALRSLGASPGARAMFLSDGAWAVREWRQEWDAATRRSARHALEGALAITDAPRVVQGALALNYAYFLEGNGKRRLAQRWVERGREIQRETRSKMLKQAIEGHGDPPRRYALTKNNLTEPRGLQGELILF